MNEHLSNVLRQDILAKDYPYSFEVCLRNPFKDEIWAWDIDHISMREFVSSFPLKLWEAKWSGRHPHYQPNGRNKLFVGITNVNKEWTAWLHVGVDTYLSIEEYFSKQLLLTKLER